MTSWFLWQNRRNSSKKGLKSPVFRKNDYEMFIYRTKTFRPTLNVQKVKKMVNFETLKSEKKEFGRNNFLEVARKKAITEDGESEFISVSRGYFLPDGSERFKKSLTIPDDDEIKKFVAQSILEL